MPVSALLTKTQEEWPFIRTAGEAEQIRIPIERDENGNDITPDEENIPETGIPKKTKAEKGQMGRTVISRSRG